MIPGLFLPGTGERILIRNEKRDIRRTVLRLRSDQPVKAAAAKSLKIAEHLTALPEFRSAQTVMLYAAFRGEVDTGALMERVIAEGKTLVLPRSIRETRKLEPCRVQDPFAQLAPGSYGILEPVPGTETVPADRVDLVAVPGVAFDRRGNRLGYGAGYYDRFLRGYGDSSQGRRPVAAGLAFEFQIVDGLPSGEHDCPVDILITECGVLRIR